MNVDQVGHWNYGPLHDRLVQILLAGAVVVQGLNRDPGLVCYLASRGAVIPLPCEEGLRTVQDTLPGVARSCILHGSTYFC